jgi:aryl carrier-like protein
VDEIESELAAVLQDSNRERPLDSLEMLIVRTTLRSHGIDVADDEGPGKPTIEEWFRWLRASSKDG